MKIRSAILQRRIAAREPPALARLRALTEFRGWSREQLEWAAPRVVRRQCLAILASELGFSSWPHARVVISGARGVSDYGTLLYPKRCCGYLNLWYGRYEDAAIGRRASGGYLLAYRRQFMVVHSSFIEALGLDPDASEWQRLGFDWVRPLDLRARTLLYGRMIAQMPREVSS